MKIGYVGLGRMGLQMVKGLANQVDIVAFDLDDSLVQQAVDVGAQGVKRLADIPNELMEPRIIWLMVPMGAAVDRIIEELVPHLSSGDVLVDGGNADYLDSIRRRKFLAEKGIGFAGAGTSGGTEGALKGPPISVDCTGTDYVKIRPILEFLGGNHVHFEDAGKGHLAKTLHNAIEYGMMQSLAEGVALYVKHGFTEDEIKRAFATWSKGSIIESRLVNCLRSVLEKHSLSELCDIKKSETLKIVSGVLRDDCPTPILATSARLREMSAEQDPVALTVLARLRNFFGGHGLSGKK